MRDANEFIKEKEIFVGEQVQKYADKKLSIFSEAIEKAWKDKTEFFKLGKVIMVDETKKLYDVECEIQSRFGGNEKNKALYDVISNKVNSIVVAKLKMSGWRYEADAESQQIKNLKDIPLCLVPIETEETSAK